MAAHFMTYLASAPDRPSLVNDAMRKNPLWRRLRTTRTPFTRPVNSSDAAPVKMAKRLLDRKTLLVERDRELTELVNTGRVGKAILRPTNSKRPIPHPLISRTNLPRGFQRVAIVWSLGRMVYHQQECVKCGCDEEGFSRQHAVRCSGARQKLGRVGNAPEIQGTRLDKWIAKWAKCPEEEDQRQTWYMHKIWKALKLIRRKCLGRSIRELEEDIGVT
jgi:hypothetical protein